MAIKVSNYSVVPELVYDNFFLEKLELIQSPAIDNDSVPNYTLRVYYRLFAVDSEHNRHYQNKVSSFEIRDYISVGVEKAQQGDMDLVNAATAIEIALAKIIEDQLPDLGKTVVT